MEIRESAEDYLEAILRLSRQGEGVRSIDVATVSYTHLTLPTILRV